MVSTRTLWVAGAFTFALSARSGPILDLNQQAAPVSTSLIVSTTDLSADLALFTLADQAHGLELWITNGTANGTRLLRDIRPGPEGSGITGLTASNGTAFFFADDGVNGRELWRSDGTLAGTRIVANIGPGAKAGVSAQEAGGSVGPPIVTQSGIAYFNANDGSSGLEAWRSNGTAAGTWRLADANAGSASSDPGGFATAGPRVFFGATSGSGARELWMTDGGDAQRVAEVTKYGPSAATDTLFFVKDSRLLRLRPGTTVPEFFEGLSLAGGGFVQFGRKVLIQEGAYPTRLHVLDVADNAPTLVGSFTNRAVPNQPIIAVGDRALIPMVTGLEPTYSLWVSDGTVAGTKPLDTNVTVDYHGWKAVQAPGQVFFDAVSGTSRDIWRTDGTPQGTYMFTSMAEYYASDVHFDYLDGKIYFAGGLDHPGRELWVSDGTSAGRQELVHLGSPDFGADPENFHVAAGRLFFSAKVPDLNLYVSDGTAAGTVSVPNVRTKATGDSSPGFMNLQGGVGLLATVGRTGQGGFIKQLFNTDGSTAGTRRLIPDASDFSFATVPMDGFSLVYMRPGGEGNLWRTDGTDAGTWKVGDFSGADIDIGPVENSQAADVAYFVHSRLDESYAGTELWITDGTPAGTRIVTRIPDKLLPWMLGALGTRGFFVVHSSTSEFEIWTTDGTEAGTVKLQSVDELNNDTHWEIRHSRGFVLDGKLCFGAKLQSAEPKGIYCTDGTSGTFERISGPTALQFVGPRINAELLSYEQAGSAGIFTTRGNLASESKFLEGWQIPGLIAREISPGLVRLANGIGVALAYDGQTRFAYVDGTSAGTRDLLPIGSALTQRGPVLVGMLGQFAFFRIQLPSAADQYEIWISDGTEQGTKLWWSSVASEGREDISWAPDQFFTSGDKLYFSAIEAETGREPYVLDATSPNARYDIGRVAPSGPTAIDVLSNDFPFGRVISPATVEIVRDPATGTVTIDPATGVISFTPSAEFNGSDTLEYRVADLQGHYSGPATVRVVLNAPGLDPAPPPPASVSAIKPPVSTQPSQTTPPPVTPDPPKKSRGGGALSLELLCVLLMLMAVRRRPYRCSRN
jgi:ELWxxDGT repeat protein